MKKKKKCGHRWMYLGASDKYYRRYCCYCKIKQIGKWDIVWKKVKMFGKAGKK